MHSRYISLSLPAVLLPAVAHAQIIISGIPGCNFSTGAHLASCIPSFIAHLIQFVFGLIGGFFLINVMIAGYQIAISGITGDKEAGKRRVTWSVVGLVVSVLAFVILDMVISLLFSA